LAGSQAEDLEPASKDKQFLGWANIFRAVAHGLMAHRKVRKIRSGGRPVRHRSAHSSAAQAGSLRFSLPPLLKMSSYFQVKFKFIQGGINESR
jgi:hypothetical protein